MFSGWLGSIRALVSAVPSKPALRGRLGGALDAPPGDVPGLIPRAVPPGQRPQ
jgi:hypothetical protein